MSKRDYYEVLGVERSAPKEEIKKAYRQIAMKHHPDRNPGNAESEAIFKEASEAAEVLLNEQKRRNYDQLGHAGVDGMGQGGGPGFGSGDFADLGDIFGDIFGDFLGGGRGRSRRGSRARRGNDIQTVINIDFSEAAFGSEKNVQIAKYIPCSACDGVGAKKGTSPKTCSSCAGVGEIRRQQGFFTVASTCPSCQGMGTIISDPCPSCSGDGRQKKQVGLAVKIPAGIDSGQRLKLAGEGESGAFGGPSGDLFVLVQVREHELFVRDGFDVLCRVPITFSQAALGAEIEVPTLSGRVAVKIPQGCQSGRKMRLKGKGVEKLGQYGRGDQIIEIYVETPTNLGPEQKELFEKLAQYDESQHSNPMGQGFFDKVRNLFQ